MVKTIEATFTSQDMPEWAKNNEHLFWLCERDLSFRRDVFAAETEQYRRFLSRIARKRHL